MGTLTTKVDAIAGRNRLMSRSVRRNIALAILNFTPDSWPVTASREIHISWAASFFLSRPKVGISSRFISYASGK